jgi:ribonuclease D
MSSDLSTPPVWVDNRARFGRMLADLGKQRRLAVDTESNSLYAYEERVCLIQFSSAATDYLVDALADLPFVELGAIMADASIEKIFHAAEYDLICLKRDYGFSFSNLFDTMHAARLLGEEKLGLADMLMLRFGVEQGKSFQKADWGQRPLSAGMQSYARLDTHYLIQLRDTLQEQLADKGLLDLAREDFERLCALKANSRQTPLYAQVSGYHTLNGRELRALDELCRFRDQIARKQDRPHFKVLGNSALMVLAREQPATRDQLENLEGVSPRLTARYASGLLEALQRARAMPPLEMEPRRRPSQDYIDRLEALKRWRKRTAEKMQVQSDIVLPRDVLESIAKSKPRDLQTLKKEMETMPWRFEHFSAEILGLLGKEK